MKDSSESFYLISTPIKKLLLKFSIPCVMTMLVSALYNIVDQIFIGNSTAGTAGIMATTLVFPFTVIALAIAQLVGDGCAALFSLSLGSNDSKMTKKCVGNSIVLVIILSILLTVLGFVFMNPILKVLGVSGYSQICQQFTRQYLTIILIGTPFYMFTSAMVSIIRADGSPQYSMMATIVGAVINLIMDPIFIFVLKMGVQGAAIAIIVGQIVSAIMCAIYFRKPKLICFNSESFNINFDVVGKTLKLGISSFITQASITIITIVANNVVGTIGGINATDAGSALGIVFKIFAIVLAFSLGVAVGGQPIIGYNYGAKKYKRVLEAYKLITITNVIIGIVAMLLFEFFPNIIVGMFGGQANDLVFYKEYAALSFRIYLGGILLCCIQKSSCIFLQSINKPYKAMILSLMRDVVILVPGVLLLGLCGDLYSMLWAGPVADIGAFIVTVIFVFIECKKINDLCKQGEVSNMGANLSNNFVVSIGREFGSGGKYIGEELAKRLNIKCYDNELLKEVSKNFNISMDILEKVDEKQRSSFWYTLATNSTFVNNNEFSSLSSEDKLFLGQAKVIEDLYEKESCIIIGRCADYTLRNKSNVFSVFIYSSDMNFKINRKKELENISEKQSSQKIESIDKQRSEYYKRFTSQIWGDKNNYELCIDTSRLGVEDSIDLLERYIRDRFNIK
ncbi:MAG: MATE family efflux transporter [Bacilli bacterium]|nr:MATE family efflux transporter [Bacilli bacterium]